MTTLIDRDPLASMPYRMPSTSPGLPDQHVVTAFDLDGMYVQASVSFGGEILFATAYGRDDNGDIDRIIEIWTSEAWTG